MLELFYAPMTRAIRVRWLLEELTLHRVVWSDSDRGFTQDTPLGKLPVLRDDKMVMCESGAIIEYILEQCGEGRLAPAAGTPERGPFLQWMHFAEGTLGPPMAPVIFHTRYAKDAEAHGDVVDVWTERSQAAFDFLEEHLQGRTWLLEQFSAADIMIGYSIAVARVMGVLDPVPPTTDAYLARLMERPAFKRATAD